MKVMVHIKEIYFTPVEVEIDDRIFGKFIYNAALDKALEMLENGEVDPDAIEYSQTMDVGTWDVFPLDKEKERC